MQEPDKITHRGWIISAIVCACGMGFLLANAIAEVGIGEYGVQPDAQYDEVQFFKDSFVTDPDNLGLAVVDIAAH